MASSDQYFQTRFPCSRHCSCQLKFYFLPFNRIPNEIMCPSTSSSPSCKGKSWLTQSHPWVQGWGHHFHWRERLTVHAFRKSLSLSPYWCEQENIFQRLVAAAFLQWGDPASQLGRYVENSRAESWTEPETLVTLLS